MLEIYLIDLFRWTLFYKSNSASISWSSDRRVAENVRALRRGKDSPFSVKSMSSAVIFAASAAGPRMSGELRPLDSSSLFGGGLVFLCFNTCKYLFYKNYILSFLYYFSRFVLFLCFLNATREWYFNDYNLFWSVYLLE